MPSVVSIQAPYGPAFQVELTRSNGEFWLQKGFEQFMDYFSIKAGYFLVFRYDFEDFFFNVTIFDKSATEIDYPFGCSKEKQPEKVSKVVGFEVEIFKGKKMLEEFDDVSMEILDKIPILDDVSRKQENYEGKKRARTVDAVSKIPVLADISRKQGNSEGNKLEQVVDDVSKSLTLADISRKQENYKGANLSQIVDSISSKPEFIEGKKLDEADDGLSIETSQKDNDHEILAHFMNNISRKRKIKKSEEITAWKKCKQPAYKRAKAFISTRPSFVSYMHYSYIKGSLSINKCFAEEFIKVKDVCDVVLKVPGSTKTWTAKCRVEPFSAKLRWKACTFVIDNGLCEGDACVFEIENDIKPSLTVHIFRATNEEVVTDNLRNTDLCVLQCEDVKGNVRNLDLGVLQA